MGGGVKWGGGSIAEVIDSKLVITCRQSSTSCMGEG